MDIRISEVEILKALAPTARLPFLELVPPEGAEHLDREDWRRFAKLPFPQREPFAALSPEERALLRPMSELDVGRYLFMSPRERELFRELYSAAA